MRRSIAFLMLIVAISACRLEDSNFQTRFDSVKAGFTEDQILRLFPESHATVNVVDGPKLLSVGWIWSIPGTDDSFVISFDPKNRTVYEKHRGCGKNCPRIAP